MVVKGMRQAMMIVKGERERWRTEICGVRQAAAH